MGKYEESARNKQTYTGPRCEVFMGAANADGSQTCNLPAYQTINGRHMCDGHANFERRKAEAVRETQAKATQWLIDQEIITPEMTTEERGIACRAFLKTYTRGKHGNLHMRDANAIARAAVEKARWDDSTPF